MNLTKLILTHKCQVRKSWWNLGRLRIRIDLSGKCTWLEPCWYCTTFISLEELLKVQMMEWAYEPHEAVFSEKQLQLQ